VPLQLRGVNVVGRRVETDGQSFAPYETSKEIDDIGVPLTITVGEVHDAHSYPPRFVSAQHYRGRRRGSACRRTFYPQTEEEVDLRAGRWKSAPDGRQGASTVRTWVHPCAL
jgi:hypothetical protein